MPQPIGDKLVACRRLSGEVWRLGKVATTESGEVALLAQVEPSWRDGDRGGWSVNAALAVALEQTFHADAIYFAIKHQSTILRLSMAEFLYRRIPAGVGPWGKNWTVKDQYWEPVAAFPKTPWLSADDEDVWFYVRPLYDRPVDTVEEVPKAEYERLRQSFNDRHAKLKQAFALTAMEVAGHQNAMKAAISAAHPALKKSSVNRVWNEWQQRGGDAFERARQAIAAQQQAK